MTSSRACRRRYTGTPASSRAVAGAGTGKHAVRAAARFRRRRSAATTRCRRAEPLEAVHGADDVDDRVERADLVQVDLLDRHAVDRGLRLGEPLEQLHRAVLALGRQRRALDEPRDLLER